MILLTALITGLANLVFSSGFLLGASGIVFMMILLASMANVRGGEIPLTFIAVAVIYMGGEIIRAFRERQRLADGAPRRRLGRRGVRLLPRRQAQGGTEGGRLDLKALKAQVKRAIVFAGVLALFGCKKHNADETPGTPSGESTAATKGESTGFGQRPAREAHSDRRRVPREAQGS